VSPMSNATNSMPASPVCSVPYATLVSVVAALGGLLFGYDLVIISGANVFLREQFSLSDAGFGFTTVSATLGCIAGPLLGAWLCDLLGRKRTLMLAALLLGVNALFTALARDIYTLNAFRLLGGIGVGLCSIGSPMYINEVAPARIRGRLGVMYQLAIVVGCITAGLVAYVLARHLPETTSWRWMFGSQLFPVLFFLLLLLCIPPSPRWLAEKGQDGAALRVLQRVHGRESGLQEMETIRASLSEETGTFSELFRPKMRFALWVGVCLAFFGSWTGWNAIGPYLPALFLKGGFPAKADAIFQFVIIYGFMGLVTVAAICLVDRLGRKPLWLSACLLMVGALVLAGLSFHLNLKGSFALLAIFLVVIPHGLAFGPLPWLMMSEIFPTRIRAKAVAIATTVLWLGTFVGGFIFPVLMSAAERFFTSVGPAIGLFALVNLLAFIFGWKWLPETRGKTLEEIASSWN